MLVLAEFCCGRDINLSVLVLLDVCFSAFVFRNSGHCLKFAVCDPPYPAKSGVSSIVF